MALGEILVSKAKITFDQLEDALVHQKYYNGKAGTHLVELGYLTLPDLEKALSEYFQVPSVSDGELENIDDFCRSQFPVEMIERFQVIPFKRFGDQVSLAMTNPDDHQAIAYLRKLLQCRLEVYALSEIRFHYYLFRHYNREWKSGDPRIRNLFMNHRKRRCQTKLDKIATTPSAPGPMEFKPFDPPANIQLPTHVDSLGIAPLAQGEELVPETDSTWLYYQDSLRQDSLKAEIKKPAPKILEDVQVEFAVI